jgi:hypothetical protein
MLGSVSGKLATLITLTVLALVAAVAATSIRLFGPSGAPPGPLEGYHHPRAIHRAPDGRLIIADLGSGHDDGQVVAIDLVNNTRTVLIDKLPSTTHSGNRYADLAGASGAAMAADGTVCVVIGYADRPAAEGFNTLRCTDGLRVDLKKFEEEHNPDGLEIDSNPFDIVWDGGDGWYVSDSGANALLHVSRQGSITVAQLFTTFATFTKPKQEGVPTGLSLAPASAHGSERIIVALYGGAFASYRPGATDATTNPGLEWAIAPHPIAALEDGETLYMLSYSDSDDRKGSGQIFDRNRTVIATGLDRPTGFARLPDGRFLVSEEARSRVRIVGEPAR